MAGMDPAGAALGNLFALPAYPTMSRDLGLSDPVSDLAQPPIHAREVEDCETAICPFHGGTRLGAQYGDRDGKVLFCPLGRMFYRWTVKTNGMYAPLKFAKGI